METIILGIDPGTQIMGYCLIKAIQALNQYFILLRVEELILTNMKNTWLKYKAIWSQTLLMIDKYHPNELAIESPIRGIQVVRAQNIALSAGLYRNLSITEYHPKTIKLILAKNGKASKQEIANKIASLFTTTKKHDHELHRYDCTDALAVALCHLILNTRPL
ncbi:crossover junction endodeoxyribonuclease RuvC [Candidatus Karelsulcia muelleri]